MKTPKTDTPERINYAEIKTKIGRIHYTHDGKSLYTVGFSKSSSLNSKLFEKKPLKRFESELKNYLSGRSKTFKTKVKILSKSKFEKDVLRALSKIPYGKTVSYKYLAKRIKSPLSSRAVGNACGKNPCAIVIPCHRIIKGDGTLGGFTGGLSCKKKLHFVEGIKVKK